MKPNYSIAFFGTPEPAVEILEYLLKSGLTPSLIVTNPDKPQGRKLVLTPSPVKTWALAHGIKTFEPEKLDAHFYTELQKTQWDLFIVVAYGKILAQKILDIPKRGSINVHYSLLPKYRGASPIESQILADDSQPGISIMLLDAKMDHGPLLASAEVKLPVWPTNAEAFRTASNDIAGKMLADVVPRWIEGKIEPKKQDESEATYTKKFTKADGLIDLQGNARINYLKFLAYHEWPGTFFFMQHKEKKIRVLIKDAEFHNNIFTIKRVVPEGKKEMSYEAFLQGTKTF